ncbi:hypothetical protein SAMN05216382_2625 [Sphingomonas palmae]|uniref:Lipoprotein n=1 Tax=Sphingomonas palmae TaxID=1855283 RepID=A0A1H7SZV9_9SPHN|nr:hypothetical protein [Sphingomonas palmae]SEL78123.1 hypothetical protein SAMN05216382_2625 [Sphingomonas palmae]
MKQVLPLAAAVLSLAACNGAPPSTTTNSMTSAGSTEPAADNIAAPETDAVDATPTAAPAASPTTAAVSVDAKKWAGRWIGVEGTYLNVTPTGANTASLEMQYDLDNKGTYPATVTPEGLRFTRGGEQMLLRPSDGDATGLKWLAGKKDCLTVKSGEGYCRA